MKEKFGDGITYEIINIMDIKMLVTSYVIRNNGGRWTRLQVCKVCKIHYCHQKSTRPHGFARHWWGPQLIQLQGPNIGIWVGISPQKQS